MIPPIACGGSFLCVSIFAYCEFDEVCSFTFSFLEVPKYCVYVSPTLRSAFFVYKT